MTEASALPGLPQLAKYELLEEIGHGGMATVYRARDKRLGREVAVKIIHKHLRENAEVGARFVAEARASAKLRHPNIVEVYDVSNEEDGERYLVAELLRGTTLRKILLAHRDMPAEVGASIVLLLCEALEHAHASGIVHRDVKPENVLVELPSDRAPRVEAERDNGDVEPHSSSRPVAARRRDSCDGPKEKEETRPQRRNAQGGDLGVVVKLTDFGIAKILDAQGVTSTGQVLGSPAHMAPEQIEAGEVDARTDVFALGVLMYECLVGHLPFEGKNPAQVLRRVLDGEYPPAAQERDTVGGRWAKIIDGALALSPADRTASPGKLGDEIRAELQALGISDFRAEIDAYFEEPDRHKEALVARLVPTLLSRGEASRKAGDVTGAAADFNRALALAPNDLAILKRVTSMTSSAARKQLLRRVVMLAGVALVLGGAAFVVARLRKGASLAQEGMEPSQRSGSSVSSTGSAASLPDDPTESPSVASSAVALLGSAEPSKGVRIKLPVLPGSVIAPSSGDRAGVRKVMFVINPPGATLVLDGREETWFSKVFTLRVGNHAAEVRVLESKCCEVYAGSVLVEAAPDAAPDGVQRIAIRLKFLPATVAFSGGPANAQLVCPGLALTMSSGATRSVTLNEVSKSEKCQLMAPGEAPVTKHLTLRAGEHHVVDWPSR